MSTYVDTGLIPSSVAQQVPQIACTGCGKRISQFAEQLRNLVEENPSMTNEEAMTRLGLKRWCCRLKLVTPHIVPKARTLYNPEVVQGALDPSLSEDPAREIYPYKKWHGNMAIVTDGSERRVIRPGQPIEHKGPEIPTIPEGYYFVRFLEIPNTWDGRQTPLYTAQIAPGKGPPEKGTEESQRELGKEVLRREYGKGSGGVTRVVRTTK